MELSRHVLGPLHNASEQLIAREGAPVGFYNFGDTGEAVAFLAEALRSLMQREPTASVALVTRYPQQADVDHDALRIAEVPSCAASAARTGSPGINVTNVRQVKGLEFDYVIVLDPTGQNYPRSSSRATCCTSRRPAPPTSFVLVCAGPVSKLIPDEVILASE